MSSLTLLGILPLVGALLIAVIPAEQVLRVKQAALGTTILVAISAIMMWLNFDESNTAFQFVQSAEWIPSFGINYAVGVDGLSLVLILLAVLLTPIVVLAGWNESEGGRWSAKVFYILILVLETMMIGVFAATDVFLFYVFFEAMLIPVYFLIGGYGSGERAAAAVKFLLFSLFGGLLMLASIIGLYVISSKNGGATFDITELSQMHNYMSSTTQNLLFLGFFIAFAIKAPLWPLHTWLPDAAASGTPGTSVLLLGVLDKVGNIWNDPLLSLALPRCIEDIYACNYCSGCYLNSLRCILGNRSTRYQAPDCLHIYLSLRIYHHGNLRYDHPRP
jgi:NADH-quinone oxidoreductase subunit M